MFVTVVIRALSRLPSRTARVRLELVLAPSSSPSRLPRTLDAPPPETDPGIPGSRSRSSGGPISSPSPPEAASPLPRAGPPVWVPRVAVGSGPARMTSPGTSCTSPGTPITRRAGDDHRRRRASRIEDRAARVTDGAAETAAVHGVPRRGRRVLARAARARGVSALLAARAGPAGLARRRRRRRVPPARPGSLAAVVDGGGEAHALAHPVRRGVRASHAVLGGTAAAIGALAAEIRADAAEPGGDGDAVPAGAAHGARDAGDDPGKRAGGVLNEASARVCALGVIGGSPGVETPVRAPRRVPDAPGGATRF